MSAKSAHDVLQREFLVLRAKILEVAAALDRIDRAGSLEENSASMEKLREAMETLLWTEGSRAEEVQLIFSRPYEPEWQAQFGVSRR
ncbi:MAG: hypothetical protein WD851_17690 [Pirellulales bacterium]